MPRKKLYILILFFAFAGYSWIFVNHYLVGTNKHLINVCLFRNITGIPCPSCGTTHSVISISKGNFRTAVQENLLGFPISMMLLVFPVWILIDLIMKKDGFYRFFLWSEMVLRKKWIAWSALILIVANWGWNIFKGG
jgi:hypothetical protein